MLDVAQENPANSGKADMGYQLFWPQVPNAFYLVISLCFLDNHNSYLEGSYV